MTAERAVKVEMLCLRHLRHLYHSIDIACQKNIANVALQSISTELPIR